MQRCAASSAGSPGVLNSPDEKRTPRPRSGFVSGDRSPVLVLFTTRFQSRTAGLNSLPRITAHLGKCPALAWADYDRVHEPAMRGASRLEPQWARTTPNRAELAASRHPRRCKGAVIGAFCCSRPDCAMCDRLRAHPRRPRIRTPIDGVCDGATLPKAAQPMPQTQIARVSLAAAKSLRAPPQLRIRNAELEPPGSTATAPTPEGDGRSTPRQASPERVIVTSE